MLWILVIAGVLLGLVTKLLYDACAMENIGPEDYEFRKKFPKKPKSGDLDDETKVACGCTWFF